MSESNFSISPQELQAKMEKGENPFILDVRDPVEFNLVNLEGVNIPLSELPTRVSELGSPGDREIIIMCHHGIRSAQAASFLRQLGFTGARNLSGGIDRWAHEIDPQLLKY